MALSLPFLGPLFSFNLVGGDPPRTFPYLQGRNFQDDCVISLLDDSNSPKLSTLPASSCSMQAVLNPARREAYENITSGLIPLPLREHWLREKAKVLSWPARSSTRPPPTATLFSLCPRARHINSPYSFCFYWSRILYKIHAHAHARTHACAHTPTHMPAFVWPPPAVLSSEIRASTQGCHPATPQPHPKLPKKEQKEGTSFSASLETEASAPPVGEQVGVMGKQVIPFSSAGSLSCQFRPPSVTATKAMGLFSN